MFRTRLNKPLNLGSEPAARLRALGLRATGPRLAILEELAGDTSHPTAHDLFRRVKARHPEMAFATVYNTLRALEAAGLVTPLIVGDRTRFDPITAPHDHVVCNTCGAVEDLPTARPDPFPSTLRGFAIERVDRVYRGTCGPCLARGANPRRAEDVP